MTDQELAKQEIVNQEDELLSKDDDLFNDDDDLMFDDFSDNSSPTMKKQGDLLKELTNFSPFIKDKINGWLGLRWSEEKNSYVPDPFIDPIMNPKCAAWCIDYLKTYTRENNIITNIGKQEYKYLVRDIIDVVWTDIGCRAEYFGITDNGDLHRICVELQHAAELILMGAGDGKYNQFLSSSTSRHETVNLSQADRMQQQAYSGQVKTNILQKIKKAFGGR